MLWCEEKKRRKEEKKKRKEEKRKEKKGREKEKEEASVGRHGKMIFPFSFSLPSAFVCSFTHSLSLIFLSSAQTLSSHFHLSRERVYSIFSGTQKYFSAEYQIKVLSTGERPWLLCSPFAYLCLPLLCLASAKNVRPFIRSLTLCTCQTTHFSHPAVETK